MPGYKFVHQHEYTSSIPSKSLIMLAEDEDLSKIEYRILMVLLGSIDGFAPSDENAPGAKRVDPLNFRKINVDAISDTLHIKKKVIRKCIKKFTEAGYLEQGSNEHVTDGYRFCF